MLQTDWFVTQCERRWLHDLRCIQAASPACVRSLGEVVFSVEPFIVIFAVPDKHLHQHEV
jgi:hypothetical protein